ncbi:MAG TPA: hypothetical protein VI815_04710 [Candidatus Nanoarchaeia archaeon]|nr:hypothetical protein [Candidatus Nanoarchaeia archaeon]
MKKSKLIILAIIILGLNIVWEFSHYRLYIDLTGIPPTTHLIIASFADLFLVFLIFFIISIFNKSISWIENPHKLDYTIIILSGILIATIIEIYSLSNGRWAYTDLMPTIFGIGLSPLVQLFTTSIIGLWLFKLIKNN